MGLTFPVRRRHASPEPSDWGLERRGGHLVMDRVDLVELARTHGTPLHVASAHILEERCDQFFDGLRQYPSDLLTCFSYKANSTAGILQVLHRAGCGAEVATGYELQLADQLGVPPESIVFNGPNKSDRELGQAVARGVGLIVADGLGELDRLERVAAEYGTDVSVALRVCPGVRPKGTNVSSITGWRHSQFGFDVASEEAREALRRVMTQSHLRLRGMMAHIGSGISDLASFEKTVGRLLDLQLEATQTGAHPDMLDVGGGLGTRHSREFTTRQMLRYLAFGRLPAPPAPVPADLFQRYGAAVTDAITRGCRDRGLDIPTLVLEPGRALVSDAQVLLLTVGAVRERPGVGRFAIADGGAMTVSLMFLSEHHAVFLANRDAPTKAEISVFGRLPSPMDVVYRNLQLPPIRPGDVLAVMDAGAYFTATETTFGGPRPAVILIENGRPRVVRRRETYEDLVARETVIANALQPEPFPGA